MKNDFFENCKGNLRENFGSVTLETLGKKSIEAGELEDFFNIDKFLQELIRENLMLWKSKKLIVFFALPGDAIFQSNY